MGSRTAPLTSATTNARQIVRQLRSDRVSGEQIRLETTGDQMLDQAHEHSAETLARTTSHVPIRVTRLCWWMLCLAVARAHTTGKLFAKLGGWYWRLLG